jgi:hypothetical protein
MEEGEDGGFIGWLIGWKSIICMEVELERETQTNGRVQSQQHWLLVNPVISLLVPSLHSSFDR